MNTGKEYTKKVREMLKEALCTGKYVYCAPSLNPGNPIRVIQVHTYRGMTIAKSIYGSEFPVSSLNIDRFYIQ